MHIYIVTFGSVISHISKCQGIHPQSYPEKYRAGRLNPFFARGGWFAILLALREQAPFSHIHSNIPTPASPSRPKVHSLRIDSP